MNFTFAQTDRLPGSGSRGAHHLVDHRVAARHSLSFRAGTCATYSGHVVSHPISRFAGYVVKTQEDFDVIAALWATVHGA